MNPSNNGSTSGKESTSTDENHDDTLRTSTPSLLSDLQHHSTEVSPKFQIIFLIFNTVNRRNYGSRLLLWKHFFFTVYPKNIVYKMFRKSYYKKKKIIKIKSTNFDPYLFQNYPDIPRSKVYKKSLKIFIRRIIYGNYFYWDNFTIAVIKIILLFSCLFELRKKLLLSFFPSFYYCLEEILSWPLDWESGNHLK